MNNASKWIIGASAVLGLSVANVYAHPGGNQGHQSMTPEARAAMQEKMRSETPEERQKLAAEHRTGMGNHGKGHGAGMGNHGKGHGAGMGCGMAAGPKTEEHKH
jgi:hypothetical protein